MSCDNGTPSILVETSLIITRDFSVKPKNIRTFAKIVKQKTPVRIRRTNQCQKSAEFSAPRVMLTK